VTAVPRKVHLLDSRGRLNAGDYVVLCWPVLERLTTAVQQYMLVAWVLQQQHVVVSLQWTDEI